MNDLIENLKQVREIVPAVGWPAAPWQIKLNASRRRLLDELIEAEEAATLSSALTEIETQGDEILKLEGVVSAADSHLDEVEEAVDIMNDQLKLMRRVISD